MADLSDETTKQEPSITLPVSLITGPLAQAPPFYVTVFLLAKACPQASPEKLAAWMQANSADVRHGIAYWAEKGLLPPCQPAQEEVKAPRRPVGEAPVYSVDELQVYLVQYDWVKELKASAEKYLGHPLSIQELSTLLSLYDWLGLPVEVIEVLLAYCCGKKNKSMRYLEKVAMDWQENGIDTAEKALAHVEKREDGTYRIMSAFGQGHRSPVFREEKYLKEWQKDFPTEIICEACSRTVMQTGKASFPYANKILSDWKSAGVATLADIERLDAAYAAKKGEKTSQPVPARQEEKNQNRFINYDQRDWDFAELERLESERRKEW